MPRKKTSSKVDFFRRAVRTIVAVVLLSTLVLGISLFVKEIATLSPSKIIAVSTPILSQLGIGEDQVGMVAGKFVERITDTGFDEARSEEGVNNYEKPSASGGVSEYEVNTNTAPGASDESTSKTGFETSNSNSVVKVAIMSDSESDYEMLQEALDSIKEQDIDSVFFIGDYTELGILEDLRKAKSVMDNSAVKYYSLPGDRDLWQSVGPENFISVFGDNYHKVTIDGFTFLMLDNSANYTRIETEQIKDFEKDVKDADFVLMATPLYHPSNTRVMGIVKDEVITELVEQKNFLLGIIRESDVKAIFGAEHHIFTESPDPEDPELVHYVNGALAKSRNLQTPRYSILNVYEDGSYDVEQVIL